jgi:hypothetical protein
MVFPFARLVSEPGVALDCRTARSTATMWGRVCWHQKAGCTACTGPHILVRELAMAVARYREENGKTSRKHGNILLRTRRETYGPGFATRGADHAKTNLVRDRVAPSIRPTPTSTRAGTKQGKAVPLMFDPFRPWKMSFALSLQVARMCWEPQAVFAYRPGRRRGRRRNHANDD